MLARDRSGFIDTHYFIWRMKTMAPRYPDFMCIGAQKAGTSWLHQMLRQHPRVWVPPTKEIHYFDVLHGGSTSGKRPKKDPMLPASLTKSLAAIKWTMQSKLPSATKLERAYSASLIGLREMTDEWYGRIFERVPAGVLCGDITPGYAILPDAGIEHILRLRAGTKIIFIIRDPIDRGWSEMRMVQRVAGAANVTAVPGHVAGERFYARSDYMATIERFRKYIPESDFLLLYFDDIAQQPREFLTKICTFLGLDDTAVEFKNLFETIHQGVPAPIPPAHYDLLRKRLAPVYERLRELHSPTVDGWYRKHYQQ
jgi:hypothetical protein